MGACTLLFLSQFQCCNAVLKYATASQADLSLTATQSKESTHSSSVAGRRKFTYVVALKKWQRLSRSGVRCPKPQACECHCDCPNTEATGQTPTSPPLCPVFPMFPTLPPPVTTTKPVSKSYLSTPAPKDLQPSCKTGQVQLSDGTCKFIDMEVINQLLKLVDVKKTLLVVAQRKYNSLHSPNCTSCPGAAAYFDQRVRLIDAHTQYRAALGMLLNALAWLKDAEKEMDDGKMKGTGDEFVRGQKAFRSHCEPWTLNATSKPSEQVCAVLCRNQPTCVGFAVDPENRWCVWFDDAKPQSEDVCSSQTKTRWLKNWQGPRANKIWLAMEKIHVFDTAITQALNLAAHETYRTNKTFMGWWDFDKGQNETVKLELEDKFMKNLDEYTGTILDTREMRKQYVILSTAANSLAEQEAHLRPPLPDAPPPMRVTPAPIVETPTEAEGFKLPLEDSPSTLTWKDFPNSEDTAWSKIHPDCPMGTPCVCDCKCRGAPPQNFVEPPPLPPTPCPPPPLLPNPAGLSAILNR